jgi:hypothetical protein
VPITTEPTPQPPLAGTARVSWKFTLGSLHATCGIWIDTTGTPGSGDLSDLATDLYGIWQDNLLPHQSTYVNLVECSLRYYSGSGEIVAESFASHAGDDSGSVCPINTAMLISWGITSSYRGGKPRTYIPGVAVGSTDGNAFLSDAKVAALTTDAATFLGLVNALNPGSITTVSLGCQHFFSAGAALTPPTFDPFVNASAQKRLCTQRRRLGHEVF